MHYLQLMPFSMMESWSCVSGGKGLVSDEMMSHTNSLGGRSKFAAINWDSRTPSSFGHNLMVSAHDPDANAGLDVMGFHEVTGKQVPGNSYGNILGGRLTGAKGTNSLFGALSSLSEEAGSTLNFSHSALPADCQDSLLIDLKLGRFLPDIMDSHNSKVPQAIPIFSSSESSMPRKRIRSGGLNSQVAYCQVYGCNRDLSSCKDYHKRHKVCEVHTKTPKVIVNGIEQRFCQQCSRFHLLAEFDDRKRSCRKRLAGHNERRRKPQVSVQAGRIGRILQSFSGNEIHPNVSRSSSLICQDLFFSGSLLNSDHEANNLSGCIKIEDGNNIGPLSAVPLPKGHLVSKHPYSFERPFNFFHDGRVSSTSSSIFANNDQCQRDPGKRNSTSHSSFQEASMGAEDFTVFDTASTIQALSGISESGCALSLLSSQSQSSSSHSSGIPVAQPLIASGIDYQSTLHGSVRELSDKASVMKSGERNSANSLLISDPVNLEFSDGILQGSDFISVKDGPTINLLQLSSQLQRVEDQRQYI